jgi:thiol reductant ABC exporter CydD subunit
MRPLDPRLLRHARATRGYLAACVLLGTAGAGLIVAQATLLASGIAGHDLSVLAPLAAVVAGRALVSWAREVAAYRSAAAVKSQLRARLLAHAVRLGPAAASWDIATLATRGIDALDGYFSRYLPQLVLAAVVPAIVLGRLLGADLLATVTVAVTLPLIPVFMALVGWTTQAHSRRQLDALTRLAHHFLDVVAGLPTLKVFGRAKAQAATIRRVTDAFRQATMRTLRVAFLSSLVLELVATVSVALVAVGVGLRLVDGRLDLRTALLVLILAPEAYLPLRAVGTHFHASTDGIAAAEQVFTVLEAAPPPRGRRTDIPRGEIRVEGLTVGYPGRAVPALSSVDLTVRPGETVALTGPSGCGKTTLLHALLCLPVGGGRDAGRITVDGVDLDDLDPDAWRSTIGWVPQRPYLFTGTVADNIRLGRPDAPDHLVRDAAAAALITDLVDSAVGENGVGLSAGQRQRVALARAFLADRPVLLLDEPTANLDGASEAAILATVRRLAAGRTVLIAAHRPTLLTFADRVVSLAPSLAGVA